MSMETKSPGKTHQDHSVVKATPNVNVICSEGRYFPLLLDRPYFLSPALGQVAANDRSPPLVLFAACAAE